MLGLLDARLKVSAYALSLEHKSALAERSF
jgi:hypothetical protein